MSTRIAKSVVSLAVYFQQGADVKLESLTWNVNQILFYSALVCVEGIVEIRWVTSRNCRYKVIIDTRKNAKRVLDSEISGYTQEDEGSDWKKIRFNRVVE